MKGYYQKIVTDRSFAILKKIKKDFEFVLIGGWAVYFYTHALKSKDIDLIIEYRELEKFKKNFEVIKNERLRKYEIKLEEIDIDLYLPHYSFLGLPVEEIIKKTTLKEGFQLPEIEILLVTKLYAYKQRKGSIKGEKDKIDIISLIFFNQFDYQKFIDCLKISRQEDLKNLFIEILKQQKQIKELGLNEFYYSRKRKEALEKLSFNY